MESISLKKVALLSCLTVLLTSCGSAVEYPYPSITEEAVSASLDVTPSDASTASDVSVNFYYDNTQSGTYYVAQRNVDLISDAEQKKVAEDRNSDPAYVKFINFFQALLVNTNQSYESTNYTLQSVDGVYQWKEYSGSIFEKLGSKELYTFGSDTLPLNDSGQKMGPLYMLVYDDIVDWEDGINVIFTDLSEQYCRNVDLSQKVRSKLDDGYSACVLSTTFTYTGALSVPTIDNADAVGDSKDIDDDRAYHLVMTGPTELLEQYVQKLTDSLDSYAIDYDVTDIIDYDEYDSYEPFTIGDGTFEAAQDLTEVLESEDCTIEDEDIENVYTDYVYNFEPISDSDVQRTIFESESVPSTLLAYSYTGGTLLDYSSINLTLSMEDETPADGVTVSYRLGSTDEMKVYYCGYPEEDEDADPDADVELQWVEMSKEEVFNNLEHCEVDGDTVLIATDFNTTTPVSNAYYVSVPVYEEHSFAAGQVPDWYSTYDYDAHVDSSDAIYTKTFQYKDFLDNLTVYAGKDEEECIGYVYILLDALPYR